MHKKYRLAILITHPVHYHLDLFRDLQKNDDIEIMVYFCSDFGIRAALDITFGKIVKWYDESILKDIPHRFLKNYSTAKTVGGFWSVINPNIIRELEENAYDGLLIHDYTHATTLLAVLAARKYHIPLIFRGESNLIPHRPRWLRIVKRIFLSIFFKQIASFLAIGTANRAYYRFYGVPEEKIFDAPYAVNNALFKQRENTLPTKEKLKRDQGIDPQMPVILFLSKLISRKDPWTVLEAYARICKESNSSLAALLFVGDGPERILLEEYVQKEHLSDVHFAGFVTPDETARFFKCADIFALNSSFEPWGLVVNEAMNFGLPIITTTAVGAAQDLVSQNENGFIITPGDTATLKERLLTLIKDETLRRTMGERSRVKIAQWSHHETIIGICDALRYSRKDKPEVIVSQPGSHHIWRVAVAAEKKKIPTEYVTSIYIRPKSFFAKFPFLLRRNYPGLDPHHVTTHGFWEWFLLIAAKLHIPRFFVQRILEARNVHFGEAAGSFAKDLRPRVFWGSLSAAKESFIVLKNTPRTVRILDAFIGHPRTLTATLEAEVKKKPELASVIKDWIPNSMLLKMDQEFTLAQKIVVGSNFVKSTLLAQGIPEEKIIIIPYGADPSYFIPKTTQSKNTINLLFVGNISVRKGCHYLLEAMKTLHGSHFRLTMIGPMEDKWFLKRYGNFFRWIPSIPHKDLPSHFNKADIYVYPSLFEGSALSIYEALASGLPVITTYESGSVITHEKEGIIIPAGNTEAIVFALHTLAENLSLHKAMAEAARAKGEYYSWDRYETEIGNLLEKLVV